MAATLVEVAVARQQRQFEVLGEWIKKLADAPLPL